MGDEGPICGGRLGIALFACLVLLAGCAPAPMGAAEATAERALIRLLKELCDPWSPDGDNAPDFVVDGERVFISTNAEIDKLVARRGEAATRGATSTRPSRRAGERPLGPLRS